MADGFAVGSTTAEFNVLADGIVRERGAKMSIRDVVGGSYTVVQFGGTKSMRLNLRLFFATHDDYLVLEGLIGQKGILEFGGQFFLCRLLEPLRETTRWASGEVEAEAQFLEVPS